MAAKRAFLVTLLLGSFPVFAYAQTPVFDLECLERGQTQAQVEALILEAADHHGLDPDLLWAKAKVESDLHPCIVSSAGAIGVMQLMPGTAIDLGVTDPFDAKQNIYAGAKFLSKLIQKFKSPQLYLAAYNAGVGAVMRKRYVPNYDETKSHLRKVLRAYQLRRGFDDDFVALQALSEAQ